MFFVYAISSQNRNYIYVGMTKDLESRINRHNQKRERTTRAYAPFDLLYSEQIDTRFNARKREIYWKSGFGKEKLRLMRDKI